MTHTENAEHKTEDFPYIPRGLFVFVFAFLCASLAADCIPDAYEKTPYSLERYKTPVFFVSPGNAYPVISR